jgi:prepilin-type N-terminal cleavage/methylation domain-containing protein
MKSTADCIRRQSGFTLTELAVVVAIIALLIGGIVMALAAQNRAREISDTRRALEQAREALIGFAIRYGRLPCPATDGSNDIVGAGTTPSGGLESFCTTAGLGVCGANVTAVQAHGQCSNPDGFVPAATLGIGPTDAQGFLLDAWQGRVRYAVTQQDMTITNAPLLPPTPYWIALTKPFTSPGGLKQIVIVPTKNPPYPPVENLQVVTGGTTLVVPAVIYSTGPNRPQPATWSLDEQENDSRNGLFIDRLPGPDFDDLVIWISPNILFNRLIAVGAI